MRRFFSTCVVLAAALAPCASPAFADVTGTNTTNIYMNTLQWTPSDLQAGWNVYIGKNTTGGASTMTTDGSTNGYGNGIGAVIPTNYSVGSELATMYVGYNAPGTLTIGTSANPGAKVYVSNSGNGAYIGYNAGSSGSSVTVYGTGSLFSSTHNLYIGAQTNSVNGSLTAEDGGTISLSTSAQTYVGQTGKSSAGALNVSDSSSTFTGGVVNVGSATAGYPTCTVTNYGTFNCTNLVENLTGVVNCNGGTLTPSGSVTINGPLNVNSGAFSMSGASSNLVINSTGTVSVSNGGSVSNHGDILIKNSVLVDGAGSSLTTNIPSTTNFGMSVGYSGAVLNPTLTIQNGGTVSVASSSVWLGTAFGQTNTNSGTLAFGTGGGTLSAETFFGSPTEMTGSGTINAQGVVTDANIVLDGNDPVNHGLTQTIPLTSSNGGTVNLNLTLSATPITSGNGSTACLGAGFLGTGSLTLENGITVADGGGTYSGNAVYLGYKPGSHGTATVTSGATWAIGAGGTSGTTPLYIGVSGTGTVNVTNGGSITNTVEIDCAQSTGGNGTLDIDGATSKVSMTTKPDLIHFLQVGEAGTGVLNITNGGTLDGKGVNSINAEKTYIGGSWGGGGYGNGTVNVDGSGSTLTNQYLLNVYGDGGNAGEGATVKITHGGTINNGYGFINNNGGSNAAVAVDGTGSSWNNISTTGSYQVNSVPYDLFVGNGGQALLSVSGGGAVTAYQNAIVDSSTPSAGPSVLQIDVGRGSSLTVYSAGTSGPLGTLTNNGIVRVVAGAGAGVVAGTPVSPISAATWNGTGTVQPLGGTWNSGTEQFTPSTVAANSGAGGAAVTIDTSLEQRMLITDTAAGTSLGVSVLPTASSASLTVTGATVTGATLASLQSLLPAGQTPLDAWGISTTGFTADNPAYLSLSLGAGYTPAQLAAAGFTRTNLSVWDYTYNGSTWSWSELPANDLTFDGTYASFTALALNDTNGCDYAVTGTPLLLGDANRDGRVDINDLTIVLANYNQTGKTWVQGEFTGSGTVDINDLTIVLANYNTSVAASAAGISAVPEPGTLLLLAAGLAGLLACAWRKWK